MSKKTARIWPGFWGWYTPNIGRYRHSSLLANGGGTSACLLSNSRCINITMCWSYTGFLDRLACSFLARLSVCSLLFGSGGQSSRNGRGATQSPSAFLCKLFSFTWMNCLSSMERPTLLWSLFLVNTDEPLLSHFSETWILFSHGLNTVGRPLSRKKGFFHWYSSSVNFS